jgi:asparagine synthase (glutamine-hydrolysing)
MCALLSGGLDSSALTALAARRLARTQEKLSTFSMDPGSAAYFQPTFDQPSRDAQFARLMASHSGTLHAEVEVKTADLLSSEPAIVRARDLPTMGDMDTSLYLLFAALREHCTVALSGESADEIFGGYPWFALEAHRPSGTFPWMPAGGRVNSLLAPEVRERLRLEDYVRDRYSDALHQIPVLAGEDPVDRRMREVYHLHLTHCLAAMLDRKDRMSMAVGLEVRVPFCDHRLVEYVWNVPWQLKQTGGMEKGLLRRAVADLLPEEIAGRQKSGFPSMQDPAYARAVRHRLRDSVGDPGSPLAPLLDASRVRWLTDQEEVPPALQAMANTAISFLLSVETWLRTYRVAIRL